MEKNFDKPKEIKKNQKEEVKYPAKVQKEIDDGWFVLWDHRETNGQILLARGIKRKVWDDDKNDFFDAQNGVSPYDREGIKRVDPRTNFW